MKNEKLKHNCLTPLCSKDYPEKVARFDLKLVSEGK